MSLNKALQAMLRRHGRPVRYLADNLPVVTTALITPCSGGESAAFHADAAGITTENRYVYISVSDYKPPAMGSRMHSGGDVYLVEQSGSVCAGGAIDYVWALLQQTEEAEP